MAEMPLLIILAGGASSRMWPLREKSLIRFGSEPLLLRQLRRFADLGLREAVIVANPDSEQDIRALAHSIGEISTTVAVQTNPKGMGDALLQAAGCINADRPIYVVQVHDVVDDQLHRDILAAFAANPTSTYLAGYEREDYPGGYLIVTGDGRITGIVEKSQVRRIAPAISSISSPTSIPARPISSRRCAPNMREISPPMIITSARWMCL